MDKYLSIITNYGCHGKCPYCITRENGIKVPKSTMTGLDKLEEAIEMTGANIVSVSGGGDPLYGYSENPLVPFYLGMVIGHCAKLGVPLEMHTSYMTDEVAFPFSVCKRVVYHPNTFEQLKHIRRTDKEIVRVVYVVTKDFTLEQIMNIAMFVADSKEIDELSFRQLVGKEYEVTDYWQDILRLGHKKLWYYIEQCDYNIYYAENKIYTKFSEIGVD